MLALSLRNISDANGLALSITGMLIVFAALLLVTLFIAALPKVLAQLDGIFPEVRHHHGSPAARAPVRASQPAAPDEALVAAIGYALHHRRSDG